MRVTGCLFGIELWSSCAAEALRYLWSVAQYGATKFSSSNGVDYYARLFALELVALVMCAGSLQPQAFLTADGVVAGC